MKPLNRRTIKAFITNSDNGSVVFSIFDEKLIVRGISSIDDFTRELNEILKEATT